MRKVETGVLVYGLCNKCNMQFELPMRPAGNIVGCGDICNICYCPFCGKRQDYWIISNRQTHLPDYLKDVPLATLSKPKKLIDPRK